MAFEPANVADGAEPVETPRRRADKSSIWGVVAMVAAVALACVAVGIAVFGSSLDDGAGNAAAFSLAGGLDQFVGQTYERMAFQVVIAALLLGYLLERWIPAHRQEVSNRGLNILYGLLVILFISAIGPLQVVLADQIFRWTGWSPLFDLRFEANRIPFALAAMLVSAVIVDFFFYWFHRLQHTSQLLWQAHLLHHTDTALNVTTTNRTHFFEHMLTPLFMATPITLLFSLPHADVVLIAVVPLIWSHLVHTNVRVGFGKFWWLLSSPQYHRIHHSIWPEHQDKNFAVWFPLWDILFGTAFAPRPGEYPQSGVEGVEVSTFSEAVTLPCVRWYRMARRCGDEHRVRPAVYKVSSSMHSDEPNHDV